MYSSAIVDECGCVVAWVENLSNDKIDAILEEHPEWRLTYIGEY